MSLLNKKSSLQMATFEKLEKTPEEVKGLLESVEHTDITNRKETYTSSFCCITDVYKKDLSLSRGILAFGIREDIKKISGHKIRLKLDEAIKEELKRSFTTKIDKELKEELKDGVIAELAVGVAPLEYLTEVIMDFNEGSIYISKKPTSKILTILDSIATAVGEEMDFSLFQPFSDEFIKESATGDVKVAKNMLFAWLYKMTKDLKEADKEMNSPVVDSKIVLKEGKNEIAIRGDVVRFHNIYANMNKDDREIKELDIVLDNGIEKIGYSLDNKDFGVKNYFSGDVNFTKDEIVSAVMDKARAFQDLKTHINSVVKMFEKNV
jgi:hypothetical protein